MRKRLTIVLTVVLVLLLGGIAYASIPGPDGVVHGCYKTDNKTFFVIDSADSCPSGTTSLNWNQTGPQGPTGTNGTDGTNGTNGIDGVSGYEVVSGTHVDTDPQHTTSALTVNCPTGKVALGGGVGDGPTLNYSRPVVVDNVATGWEGQIQEVGNQSDPIRVNVWVICAFAS